MATIREDSVRSPAGARREFAEAWPVLLFAALGLAAALLLTLGVGAPLYDPSMLLENLP
jgi:hypothetical protein